MVFSPQGAWVCDETPLKPAGSVELKRENRTFWMDLPRADSEQVQRMMALRREQPVEQVEQIAGNPAIEEKRQGIEASANPVVQDNEDTPVARARKPPLGPTADELDKHELTHVVFRSWCKLCISSRAKEDPHRSVATHEGRTPKVMLDWMFFTSDQEPGVQLPVLVVYDLSTGAVMAMQSTKDSSVVTVGAVVQTLETWGHTDVVLHADGEPATKSLVRSVANARVHRTLPRHGPPHSHQSQGPVSICKFGEQVHYKLSGHPSSRVEPRWELGAWVGKTELTDEHLLGTLSGIRNSRTIYRLPKSHCYNKDALDRIVGTPANPKPEGAAKDPQIRRPYITQRWVDEHGVTPGCPRCEGRGTMTHSEACRRRFDEIEKKKLDKRLEEEAARIPEPPSETVHGMDVEQAQEQPLTGGASSSCGPVAPVQEAVPMASPSSHEVRMVETSRSNTRPLEEVVDGGEARNLAGMLLFDDNDTSDWQETVWEAQLTEVLEDHDGQEILMDQQAQSDTDVPGVWRCQIEARSDLYGDKTGKFA